MKYSRLQWLVIEVTPSWKTVTAAAAEVKQVKSIN